jgi:hypothetical protein
LNLTVEPYIGIFYAGYGLLGALILMILFAFIYLSSCANRPKFLKYTNNNTE